MRTGIVEFSSTVRLVADNFIVKASKTKFYFNSIMLYASINTTAIDLSYPVMTKHNGEIWGDNVYEGTDTPSITDGNGLN